MEWIKATPETMPPEGVELMVTIQTRFGVPIVSPFVKWENGKWLICTGIQDYVKDDWKNLSKAEGSYVSHWMRYPEPAKMED